MKKNTSFTLIELLVVIVIIGVLAGVIMVTTTSSVSKANITKLKVFEESVANNLAANMVSRWKLDEVNTISNPDTTPDAWGNNTGNVYGTTLQSEENCISGSCLYFNGTSTDYIDCGNNISLSTVDAITISAWIKTNVNTVNEAIVMDTFAGNNIPIEFYIESTNRRLYFGSYISGAFNQRAVSVNTISSNEWIHVLASFDKNLSAQANKIFINGLMNGSGDMQTLIPTRYGTLRIGSYGTGWNFKGTIDDVRIYNAALSSAQVKQNYIAGLKSLLASGNISKEEYNQRINSLSGK